MTTRDRADRILSDLEKLIIESEHANRNCEMLAEKVEAKRLGHKLASIRIDVLHNYYPIENIEKHIERNP